LADERAFVKRTEALVRSVLDVIVGGRDGGAAREVSE
jgi:hypothetical protein